MGNKSHKTNGPIIGLDFNSQPFCLSNEGNRGSRCQSLRCLWLPPTARCDHHYRGWKKNTPDGGCNTPHNGCNTPHNGCNTPHNGCNTPDGVYVLSWMLLEPHEKRQMNIRFVKKPVQVFFAGLTHLRQASPMVWLLARIVRSDYSRASC